MNSSPAAIHISLLFNIRKEKEIQEYGEYRICMLRYKPEPIWIFYDIE